MIKITVVGPGCRNCERLEHLCKEVVQEMGIQATIEKVTDVNQFADLGIFMTPGLLINNEIKIMGKLPAKSWIQNWIQESIQKNS
jgi:small redox-active disulfide protein 2